MAWHKFWNMDRAKMDRLRNIFGELLFLNFAQKKTVFH